MPFHPYYTAKDGFGLGVFLILYCVLLFFLPNYARPPGQLHPGQPAQRRRRTSCPNGTSGRSTRSCAPSPSDFFFIPAKLMGVLAMFSAILVWFFLPWLDKSPVRSGHYRPLFRKFFWFGLIPAMAGAGLLRRRAGGRALRDAQPDRDASTTSLHFLVILPIVSSIERPEPLPFSITEAVLGEDDRRRCSANNAHAGRV